MLIKTPLVLIICFALILLFQCKTKHITEIPLESHYDTIVSIDLSQKNIGSYPKKYLAYRNILHLNISGIKLSDTILSNIIKAYPKLQSLTLDECNLNRLPTNINSLKFLTYLSLVNNKNLENIPNCNQLQYLNVKGCSSLTNFDIINQYKKITYLNLSETSVDSQQLSSCHLIDLKYLNISNTNIENIFFVNSFPKLLELDIRNTKITEVSKIKNTFPKLKIIYTDSDTIKKQLKETKLVKPYF